jgi:hypothetical protein
MNRVVELDQPRSRAGSMRETARLAQALSVARRSGSSRQRTEADRAIITRMMLVEIARRRDEGRLVQIGPREYELHPRTR